MNSIPGAESMADRLVRYAGTRNAIRAEEAARALHIPVSTARHILNGMVERGHAVRLRPIGCCHAKHDHYRMVKRARPSASAWWARFVEATRAPDRDIPMLHLSPRLARRAAHWGITILMLSAAGWTAPAQSPGSPKPDLDTLDGLVGEWLDLKTEIADEQRSWDEKRRQWNEEIRLLRQEAESLQAEIDEADAFTSSVERERADALARKEAIEAELQEVRTVLERAEADLRRWRDTVPASLRTSLAAAFRSLPADRDEAESLSLSKRGRTVAALYSQIESLQNRFHVVREMLEVEGVRRQVDVLYAGLARGFAVSPGDDWAAVGTPGENGWTWTRADPQADAIRLAIDVFQQRETARMVSLPVETSGEVQP